MLLFCGSARLRPVQAQGETPLVCGKPLGKICKLEVRSDLLVGFTAMLVNEIQWASPNMEIKCPE